MSNYDLHLDILSVLENVEYDDGEMITEDDLDWDTEIWIGKSIRITAGQARDAFINMSRDIADRAESNQFLSPSNMKTFVAYAEALYKFSETGETGLEDTDIEESLDSRFMLRKHK